MRASLYLLHPAVAIEPFGGRSLAFHAGTMRLVELNETARTVLLALDGQTALEDIAASLALRYNRDERAVLADVKRVVERMLELGFVTTQVRTNM